MKTLAVALALVTTPALAQEPIFATALGFCDSGDTDLVEIMIADGEVVHFNGRGCGRRVGPWVVEGGWHSARFSDCGDYETNLPDQTVRYRWESPTRIAFSMFPEDGVVLAHVCPH